MQVRTFCMCNSEDAEKLKELGLTFEYKQEQGEADPWFCFLEVGHRPE